MASSGDPQWALIERMLTIAPPRPPVAHGPDRVLHQEERRPGVDVEKRCPVVDVAVENRRAIGEAGGVDEGVDPPEAGEARRDQAARAPRRRRGRRATNSTGVPARDRRSRTCSPRTASRPVSNRPAAPARVAASAIASPTPWVAPVTSTMRPSRRTSISTLWKEFSISKNMEGIFSGSQPGAAR